MVALKVQTVWGLEGGAAFWPCLPIAHQANLPGAKGLRWCRPVTGGLRAHLPAQGQIDARGKICRKGGN